jgi:replication factor C subunit 1
LTFVFTGELESVSREEGQDAVKRCGGRVTGQPSGRTDYMVAGKEAGPSKMAKAEALGIKVLDEDAFLKLIDEKAGEEGRGDVTPSKKRSASPATQTPSKRVASPGKRETPVKKQATPKKRASPKKDIISASNDANSLWTVKYAPQCEADLVGNHKIFESLCNWLRAWKPSSEYHAALLSGPPGIGKTTMAHLAAKLVDMDVYELNASDTRNKQSLHDELKEALHSTSLRSYFYSHAIRKQVIIMDEVDGMSSGDRGGMAELISLLKKTRVPIICICNDRSDPKVRSLANYCMDLHLRRYAEHVA